MKEKRIYKLESLEVRDNEAGTESKPEIRGRAAVFNSESKDLGGFVEIIEPGAFSLTLASGPDVRATIDHKGGLNTLGRTTNGTLYLNETEAGLDVIIHPPNTQSGRDALTLVKRGDLNKMSFAFYVPPGGDSWGQDQNGQIIRRLKTIELNDGDVSLVSNPAYAETSAEARSIVDQWASPGPGQPENEAEQPGQAARAARERKLKLLEKETKL